MQPGRCVSCGKVIEMMLPAVCELCGAVMRPLTAGEQARWDRVMLRHADADPLLRETLRELAAETVPLL